MYWKGLLGIAGGLLCISGGIYFFALLSDHEATGIATRVPIEVAHLYGLLGKEGVLAVLAGFGMFMCWGSYVCFLRHIPDDNTV